MIRFLLAICVYLIPALSFVILPQANVFSQPVLDVSQTPAIDATRLAAQDHVSEDPLPVVIWHGLGDSADAEGLGDVADLVAEVNPGTYVHIISLAEGSADRSQSWFGNVNEQIETVCQQLSTDPILSTAPAIDAIGFSQGGQFLRGYIERCGHWAPKVRSLLTFGSQHNGIAEFQECKGWTDFLCNSANALLKSSFVWSDYIQTKVVPAQYYRATNDWDNYLEHSNFIADVNNERPEKNATYAENLSQLENFVMILFEDDKVVIPKETGWFAQVDLEKKNVTLLRERKIYKEDWIGLKKLDEKGALIFESVKGDHMRLNDKDLVHFFKKYFGPIASTHGGSGNGWKPEL